MKSAKNKTIDITVDEGRKYLDKCIKVDKQTELQYILDKTICGDAVAVLPLLPEKFADLAIIDPPYNLDKNFHGDKFRRMSDDEYAQYTAEWINLIKPILTDNASIYVCCDWTSSAVIGLELKKHFHIQNRITWQREKGRGARTNWKNSMEDIWFATNSNQYTFNADDVMQRKRVVAPYRQDGIPKDWQQSDDGRWRNTYPSNFWDDISVPYWSMAENTAHPTQKPEKLIAKLILASSNKGDIVLDPFLGSGTTSVTAKKLGRHFVGIERSEQYCVWAQKRLENADINSDIQGYTDGVFWERNTLDEQKKYNRQNAPKS